MDFAKAIDLGKSAISAGRYVYKLYRGRAHINVVVEVNVCAVLGREDRDRDWAPWEFEFIVDITNVSNKEITLLSMRIVGAEERLLGQDFRAAGDGPSLPGKLNADQWARYTYGGVFQRTDLSANPPIRKSIDGQRLEIRHSHSEKPVVVLRKEWGVHPEVEQMRAGAAVEDRANG